MSRAEISFHTQRSGDGRCTVSTFTQPTTILVCYFHTRFQTRLSFFRRVSPAPCRERYTPTTPYGTSFSSTRPPALIFCMKMSFAICVHRRDTTAAGASAMTAAWSGQSRQGKAKNPPLQRGSEMKMAVRGRPDRQNVNRRRRTGTGDVLGGGLDSKPSTRHCIRNRPRPVGSIHSVCIFAATVTKVATETLSNQHCLKRK